MFLYCVHEYLFLIMYHIIDNTLHTISIWLCSMIRSTGLRVDFIISMSTIYEKIIQSLMNGAPVQRHLPANHIQWGNHHVSKKERDEFIPRSARYIIHGDYTCTIFTDPWPLWHDVTPTQFGSTRSQCLHSLCTSHSLLHSRCVILNAQCTRALCYINVILCTISQCAMHPHAYCKINDAHQPYASIICRKTTEFFDVA